MLIWYNGLMSKKSLTILLYGFGSVVLTFFIMDLWGCGGFDGYFGGLYLLILILLTIATAISIVFVCLVDKSREALTKASERGVFKRMYGWMDRFNRSEQKLIVVFLWLVLLLVSFLIALLLESAISGVIAITIFSLGAFWLIGLTKTTFRKDK